MKISLNTKYYTIVVQRVGIYLRKQILAGEFILTEWKAAGLNIETAVKRGIYTIKETLIKKRVGKLKDTDAEQLEKSLRNWLELP